MLGRRLSLPFFLRQAEFSLASRTWLATLSAVNWSDHFPVRDLHDNLQLRLEPVRICWVLDMKGGEEETLMRG